MFEVEKSLGKHRSLLEVFEQICDKLNIIITNKDKEKIVLMPAKNASMTVTPTKFKVYINETIEIQGKNLKLLDFRLCSGCGLDFKRHFVAMEAALKKYSEKIDPFAEDENPENSFEN